jgi:hypothetical protein
MPPRIPIKQKSPFFLKRLRYLLSRLHGTRLQKDKSLHYVTINGQRFKRIILCDSYLASQIERALEHFSDSGYFPRVITRYEQELWVEFVDGERIQTVDEELVEKIADFYATLYAERPRRVDAVESGFPQRLRRDLGFLHQIALLDDRSYRDLNAAAKDLEPEKIWLGFDYTDPVLKNFVVRPQDNTLCAIDVDGLSTDQLIGQGVMKACARWLPPFESLFFERLAHQRAPDFQAYLPFVKLCFLAKWTKQFFFERKWKAIDPSLFDEFRARPKREPQPSADRQVRGSGNTQ